MKIRIILFATLICAGVLFARNMLYNHSITPRLPLDSAYKIAMTTLGQATNDFHCVGAGLAISFSPDGEWLFSFCSTNGNNRYVTVEFDGKTHVEQILVR
ncbi:MAG: hypothetical protein P4N60_08895 [Verrucomicrobiae bacterium]|nr:hypothetical protein [Verrucomicrobiae bacterium]